MATKRETPRVADRVRQALASSGKSRYQVSKESGVDQAALHRFVNGASLRVASLEAVAEALGLEIVVRKKGG